MADCVGCGYCCMKATCVVGFLRYIDEPGICPALIWSEESNRYFCQLALDEPERIGEKELYIGEGCSSSFLNSWRVDVRKRINITDNTYRR